MRPCRLGALPPQLCFRRSSRCLPPRRRCRRQLGCQATAAPELDLPPQPVVGTPSPAELEAREERALAAGRGDIYGIPRQEWTKLQSPSRYLGNEFGSVHKPWEQAEIRFALTYPEIYEGGCVEGGWVELTSGYQANQLPYQRLPDFHLPSPTLPWVSRSLVQSGPPTWGTSSCTQS